MSINIWVIMAVLVLCMMFVGKLSVFPNQTPSESGTPATQSPNDTTSAKKSTAIPLFDMIYWEPTITLDNFLLVLVAVLAFIFGNKTRSTNTKPDMTSDSVSREENVSKVNERIKAVKQNHNASVTEKAITNAYTLQRGGRIEEALEKWRAIANIEEGNDNDIAAQAWVSVGSLYNKKDKTEDGLSAINRAIELRPDYAEAYLPRGNMKFKHQINKSIAEGGQNQISQVQDQADLFLADYDKAIELNPNYTEAYVDRGNVKRFIGRNEEALSDFDEAIRKRPDYALAYANRGMLKFDLGRLDEASADCEIALKLAEEQEIQSIKAMITGSPVIIRINRS